MYVVALLLGHASDVEDPVVAEVVVAVFGAVVLLMAIPAAVNIMGLMAYKFSLFGPPHSSELLPPHVCNCLVHNEASSKGWNHTMPQSVLAASVLPPTRELPQKH